MFSSYITKKCLIYILGYTKKINEFKFRTMSCNFSHRFFVTVVIYVIFIVYVAKKMTLTLTLTLYNKKNVSKIYDIFFQLNVDRG